jgi:hypothetical protein
VPTNNALPHEDTRNTRNARHRYSLSRALAFFADKPPGHRGLTGLEGEVHAELEKRNGQPAQGFLVPWAALLGADRRALDTSAGTGAIPDYVQPELFVDALRNRLVCGLLGATVGDLAPANSRGDRVKLPRFSAASAPTWVSEAGSNASNPTIDGVSLTPTSISAYADITTRMMHEATPDFDEFVASEITRSIAQEVDRTALNGSGTAPEPTGILANSSVPTVALGTSGAAPTRAFLASVIKTVGNNNGESSADARMGWALSVNTRAKLQSTDGSTATAGAWLMPGSTILDLPAVASKSLPDDGTKGSGSSLGSLIYGDWSSVVIHLGSAVDVLVNPYLMATSGIVRVSVFQEVAVGLRQPKSFAKCVDIVMS